ncbi:MAG: acetylornithine deacetylase [Rhodospirillales bacterium 69-11]|nr:M20/M25/M40 family metallo-hydrolase [Rhodospirillales bacterium]OJW24308.1 MAG: acetylornithine deacetylase [Rhodospirillales bacterium 69-11]
MSETLRAVTDLTADLVRLDSRSSLSNLPVADQIEAALAGFEIERLDYTDAAGVAKRCLVAHRGGRGGKGGGLALSGHMDTVPDTGWQEDPWSARIDGEGVLHGLGSTDMKGPVAAAIVAATTLPADVPVTLLITTDEETTKAGARQIAQHSALVRQVKPAGILVVEPTSLVPVRGHRAHIAFTAVATGVQAHSSTGKGRNANWDLVPFLMAMRDIHERLRTDTSLQDSDYDPPFSDFNLVVDNHGTAVNVSVPVATARIKFRYSAKVDPTPILDAVRAAAERAGVMLTEAREGHPPELPADHPLVRLCVEATGKAPVTAPFGTDASELQAIAPCVVLGPSDIGTAHTPHEAVRLDALAEAVPLFQRLATRLAG